MKKLTLLLALWPLACFSADQLQVETTKGAVIGAKAGATFVFKGIPYAAPPVGELRFQAPEPHSPWSTPLEAKTYGAKCLQIPFSSSGRETQGSEDCLFLNVWRPANTELSKLPVMVWVHGGGNVNGSSNDSLLGVDIYDGAWLSEHGPAVIVTINYRLGPLGFLAHPKVGSGNYALLDQLAALRWVQENAASFGGDASNVTLFGESAGAINTLSLLASPLSKGLFHRAIVQSGFLVEIPLAVSEEIGVKLSTSVGCEEKEDTAACLRTLSGAAILAAADYGGVGKLRASVPTIDGNVLSAGLLDTFRSGRAASVPLLIGATRDEMSTLGAIAADTDKVTTPEIFEERVRGYYGEKAEGVLALYPVSSFVSPRRAIEELLGDDAVHCPTRRIARALRGAAPVWNYLFSHVGDHPFSAPYRAAHAFEVPYVFHNQVPLLTTPREKELADKIATYWLNFARSGNPNSESLPPWPRNLGDHFANLDIEITSEQGFHAEKCDFLDTL